MIIGRRHFWCFWGGDEQKQIMGGLGMDMGMGVGLGYE